MVSNDATCAGYFLISFTYIAFTSSADGILSDAPRRVTAIDAARFANAQASLNEYIPMCGYVSANAPTKVSPAPVVSTAATLYAGSCSNILFPSDKAMPR